MRGSRAHTGEIRSVPRTSAPHRERAAQERCGRRFHGTHSFRKMFNVLVSAEKKNLEPHESMALIFDPPSNNSGCSSRNDGVCSVRCGGFVDMGWCRGQTQ